MVWSDGGRGSYGGGREWCRVMERGSSPGLVVACVCTLLPMFACHCLCLHVVARVSSCSWEVVFICEQLPLFVGGHLHSCAFIFVHMQSSLFMCSHHWAVVFVHRHLSLLMDGCHCSWVVLLPVQCGGGLLVCGGGSLEKFMVAARLAWLSHVIMSIK